MNVARIGLLLAGLPNTVSGVTVNRFCSSGLQAVSMAADRIRLGEADVMIAAGAESMSMIPMGGNKIAINEHIFDRDENIGIGYGMGITAEKVAQHWNVSREAQDRFATESHRKALAAIEIGRVRGRDHALTRSTRSCLTSLSHEIKHHTRVVSVDEGPRAGTTPEVLAKLRPAFAANGSVTAGNSSQTSDGAGRRDPGLRSGVSSATTCGRWPASSASRWPACRRRSWASARSSRFRRCSSRWD